MTEVDKEKLLDKIRKILAKASNNPSEAEAEMAANMAQEMLARYNLSMSDVQVKDSSQDEIVTDKSIVTASHPWRRVLAPMAAKLYFCEYMFIAGGGKNVHMFIGGKGNVAVATMMFVYFLATIEKLAQQSARQVPASERSAYRTSFRGACASRLATRIRIRIEETKRGTSTNNPGNLPALFGLYDAAQQANRSFIEKQYPTRKSVSTKVKNLHDKGYRDGYSAADGIGLDQQVGGRKPTALLR